MVYGGDDPTMRRLVVTFLIAIPVFLALSWWNAFVGVLFGIAALAWVLAGAYFRLTGFVDDESRPGSRRRD